jgi:hypothetical protein
MIRREWTRGYGGGGVRDEAPLRQNSCGINPGDKSRQTVSARRSAVFGIGAGLVRDWCGADGRTSGSRAAWAIGAEFVRMR